MSIDKPLLRPSVFSDCEAIERLYRLAFPDENLVPLVLDLLNAPDIILSIVAPSSSEIAGHGVFTLCQVDGNDVRVSLLGPLAVSPDFQRQGIGSAIVHSGVSQLRQSGVDVILLLGDPSYYQRFGFEVEQQITPPFELPEEYSGAWQSYWLTDAGNASGKLIVPEQWNRPSLWLP
ncbi:MAG: GNAT family N-acetyltransferase [Granulosicoccus sp.]